MKKLLLVLAAALVMVACDKKTNEPTPQDPTPQPQKDTILNNLIYDQFKEIVPLTGKTKTDFISALTKAGWTQYESLDVYVKNTDNTNSQVTFATNSTDVVYSITCGIYPYMKDGSTYKPQMTADMIRDAVLNKINYNFEFGADKTDCRFFASYNNIGQKVSGSLSDFDKFFNASNFNASTTYYLASSIQQWNPESTTDYIGVKMNVNSYNVEGSSATEFSVAFVFIDETKK